MLAQLNARRVAILLGATEWISPAGEPPVRASVVAQCLHEYLGLAYYRALGWI